MTKALQNHPVCPSREEWRLVGLTLLLTFAAIGLVTTEDRLGYLCPAFLWCVSGLRVTLPLLHL